TRLQGDWSSDVCSSDLSALILLTPRVGLERVWSSVAAISARNIFASELTTYGRAYLAPHLWHDVPLGIQLVVLLAISVLLLGVRWSRSLRVVVMSLVLVVGGTQLATVARAAGLSPGLFERLPRPLYMEYHLPVFY